MDRPPAARPRRRPAADAGRSAIRRFGLATLLAFGASACGDRPGPVMHLGDVADGHDPETCSCVVPESVAAGPATWVVRPGDTLSSIAQRCYGDATQWPDIEAANPGRIGPRHSVTPGTTLRIPYDSR